MEKPAENGYTIYTKNNCGWCRRAKELLPNATVYSCDIHLNKDRQLFLSMIDAWTGVHHHTFPIIFLHGQLIVGGYESAKKNLDFNTTMTF